MKKIFVYLFLANILLSCKTTYYENILCGKYNHSSINQYDSIKILYTLVLHTDLTYSYYQENAKGLGIGDNKKNCVSPSGIWKKKGKYIVLNSYFPKNTIKIIKQKNLSKDSIKIEVLKMSDNSPQVNADIMFELRNNIFEKASTDSNGIIIYPKQNVKKIACIFNPMLLNVPQKGRFYRLYDEDCFLWNFDKKKFRILDDSTLVEKIVSKPKNVKKITIECKYIKDINPNSE